MIKHNIGSAYTSITQNTKEIGEFLETKIERIVNNNEPITDGAPIIYQERGEGINPDYDIRTDRFDVAIEAMDIATKSKLAKRLERHKTAEQKAKEKAESQSTQGTELPPQGS